VSGYPPANGVPPAGYPTTHVYVNNYGGHPAPGYPPATMVQPKSPAVGLIVSFFIPGVGSFINGDTNTGAIILIGWFVSLLLSAILIGFPFVLGFWVWGMIDGYSGARRWNARHGIVS